MAARPLLPTLRCPHRRPSHHPQVRMQREALDAKKKARVGLAKDDEWSGDGFVSEAASMVSNN